MKFWSMWLGGALFLVLAWVLPGYAQYKGQVAQDAASLSASKEEAQNILFILDASDSMNDRTGGQTKMEAAKRIVMETVRSLPKNVNVGLRVYGHRTGSGGFAVRSPIGTFMTGGEACRQSELVVPVAAQNRAAIASELLNIEATGKTPITYTLQQAVSNDFVGLTGRKTIILVSDGRETCSFNPCDFAVEAVRQGIDVKINTIGFGTRDRLADEQLRCVALATKGRFYSVDTAAQLAKSLQDSVQVQTSVQARIYSGN